MAPQKQMVLKLTSFRYKKEGISEKEFHEYASKSHAPKAAIVQARHGAIKVCQYHTPSASKRLITEKIPWAVRPGWEIEDHDIMVSVYVPNAETAQAIVTDPDFQSLVAGEDEICDQTRAKLTAGWEEVFVEDGKVVGEDYGSFEELTSLGHDSKTTSAPEGIRI
ncbi:hypothetical protein AnigIFM63604_005791 [Aspergillus niger]|uniref:FtsJ-like methyltransferase family protein n=2 Tax=Aspergillus niger TaxID=5061 RepID=A0A254UFH4_ASPNG|nr:hypothetical protein ANI_1_2162094 [Aspergillus niger CBS 513.88]XP_025459954.1 uncharacterized protein BO96DRAFT_406689 [Aspergillus niger CBS 101883]RDH14836.1 hypothetical protein M747DRAFT_374731 [Aspergillus niger ATCC 13496]TPR04737.1 FtsJ-like methyltransferase family protein [Aspergillus niger]PYH61899.1 hypothetical protein BO96DRAFT_406689 [Aspergillus niger CBS 101883]SPB51593.1 unnamed protein product [Aspergillus niger]GJP96131.1 EthD domain-domain-containing protein [Aspergil|eukprot:XP_001394624.2 hypothetical protein ANI_1_2162094 [Aspergillus niger CBS 513.88]